MEQPVEEQPVEEQPVEEQPVEEPQSGPVYIITFDELVTSQQALLSKESADRIILQRFVSPDSEEMKRKLLQWAGLGFPDTFCIFSVSIDVPSKCSDGAVRNKFQYVEYLLEDTLGNKFQALAQKIPGMVLSYSLPENQVCMHVSKAGSS
jgi:hypothetical protein